MNPFELVLKKAAVIEDRRRIESRDWWRHRALWVDGTQRADHNGVDLRPTEDRAIYSLRQQAAGSVCVAARMTYATIEFPVAPRMWHYCFACKEWKEPRRFALDHRGEVASYCKDCSPIIERRRR